MFSEFCYPCRHVLTQERPVAFVARDDDDWTFSCGRGDHRGLDDWGYARTQHLVDADRTLRALADLAPGERAARYGVRSPWLRLPASTR